MTNTLSDEELMLQLVKGNKQAFDEIYKRYSARIYTFLMRTLNNETELAQDLLQNIFVKIAVSPEKFDTNRVFKPWIYTVAYNECKMHWRSPKNQDHQDIENVYHLHNEEELSDMKLHQKEIKQLLRKLVHDMEEPHRTVISLRYFDELSLKEIADIMNTSEGTVKSRLFYGLKKLSLLLKNIEKAA